MSAFFLYVSYVSMHIAMYKRLIFKWGNINMLPCINYEKASPEADNRYRTELNKVWSMELRGLTILECNYHLVHTKFSYRIISK